jgi:hypothetical protein
MICGGDEQFVEPTRLIQKVITVVDTLVRDVPGMDVDPTR